jgi:hypothetical protein
MRRGAGRSARPATTVTSTGVVAFHVEDGHALVPSSAIKLAWCWCTERRNALSMARAASSTRLGSISGASAPWHQSSEIFHVWWQKEVADLVDLGGHPLQVGERARRTA